ncbi:MAG TPA: Gfo/Idh/MocA family oxidoreductase [Clostridiales bacterium]|nr:Gfo/Idh/MocA family oxidoreductase [Clostridiales bacterium]
MKVCIIGDCGGHIGCIFDGENQNIEYIGASVSSEYEKMDSFLRFAKSKGKEIPFYENWKDMLIKLNPDIVAVDTVFSNHAKVAQFALENNIHVYCEKPVATEIKDLEGLRNAHDHSGARLFAMMTMRYEPWFYTAKKLIENGAVGKILMINAQKSYKLGSRAQFYKKRQTYGGTIPWVSIHMIDQILWLTGKKCKSVYARHSAAENRGCGELEMTAIIMMELENDILCHINTDYLRPSNAPTHGDDRIRIAGTDGVLEVREGKVYLINNKNDGIQVELLKPPKIFDSFLHYIKSDYDPIYEFCDGIYSTYVSLKARESADSGHVIRID